jgi:hypothetical protein
MSRTSGIVLKKGVGILVASLSTPSGTTRADAGGQVWRRIVLAVQLARVSSGRASGVSKGICLGEGGSRCALSGGKVRERRHLRRIAGGWGAPTPAQVIEWEVGERRHRAAAHGERKGIEGG